MHEFYILNFYLLLLWPSAHLQAFLIVTQYEYHKWNKQNQTGICTATFAHDNFRNNLLYLPAISILSLLWLGIGYEIVGGRINPLVLGAFGTPAILSGAKAITDNLIFPNNYVAYGACPTCEAENRIYFGDILGVEGYNKEGKIKCTNCKSEIIVQRRSLRASTLPKWMIDE